MKLLTLYVHAAVQDDVGDALRTRSEVTGFTVTRCEGHSTRAPLESASARDRVVGHVPRARFDIVLEADDVESVLDAVRAGLGAGTGLGVWLVVDLDGFGRV